MSREQQKFEFNRHDVCCALTPLLVFTIYILNYYSNTKEIKTGVAWGLIPGLTSTQGQVTAQSTAFLSGLLEVGFVPDATVFSF